MPGSILRFSSMFDLPTVLSDQPLLHVYLNCHFCSDIASHKRYAPHSDELAVRIVLDDVLAVTGIQFNTQIPNKLAVSRTS